MRYIIFAFCIMLLIAGCKTNVEENDQITTEEVIPFNAEQIEAHNSKNSLDWEGSYSGVLPCEDCMGIDTFLKLNRDQTYSVTQRFVDSIGDSSEAIRSEGEFFWNEEGSAITLENIKGEISTFRIGELFLTPINRNGIEVRPVQGNNFKLLKQ